MPKSESLIRPADLEKDGGGILAVLERNLPGAGAPERFEWLYLSNPDGRARVWVAQDDDGRIIGTSAAFPRRFRLAGKITMGLVLGDFALDASFRSLGPALRLLKETLAPVRDGEFAFSYDYPSESMRALYRRLGSLDLGASVRWARLLRPSGIIRRRFGSGVLPAAVGALADSLLATKDSIGRPPRNVDVRELEGGFDSRFDALDAEMGGLNVAVGVRDARYLEWKYGRHTMWPHRTLVASRDGTLTGFAITRMTGDGTIRLVDLYGTSTPDQRALGYALVRLARRHHVERIDGECLADSGFSRMLEGLAFVRREEGVGPVPVLAPDCPAREKLITASNWWLNGGDRDI